MGYKNNQRAIRRAHYKRRKSYCFKNYYWGRFGKDEWSPSALGKVANTPKVISDCLCCMNQRAIEGPTAKERVAEQALTEGLAEYYGIDI
tara:strand:- start:1150 stop:1419 length:270 start_codon:yes stop_codon:yes gene_type:complete